ncbi:hypothetical protein [Streptomyces sp. NPDC048659]
MTTVTAMTAVTARRRAVPPAAAALTRRRHIDLARVTATACR